MARSSLAVLATVLAAVLLLDRACAQGNYPVIRPTGENIRNCPRIYDPVCCAGCRTPMRTFPNLCEARVYAERNGESLLVLHRGPCDCPRFGPPGQPGSRVLTNIQNTPLSYRPPPPPGCDPPRPPRPLPPPPPPPPPPCSQPPPPPPPPCDN